MNIGSERFTLNQASTNDVILIAKKFISDYDPKDVKPISGIAIFTGSSLDISLMVPGYKISLACKGDLNEKDQLVHEIYNVVSEKKRHTVKSTNLNSSNNYIQGSTKQGLFRLAINKT